MAWGRPLVLVVLFLLAPLGGVQGNGAPPGPFISVDSQDGFQVTLSVGNLPGGLETLDWSFGDGASSNQNPATHTYTAPGSYDVVAELQIEDDPPVVIQTTILILHPPPEVTLSLGLDDIAHPDASPAFGTAMAGDGDWLAVGDPEASRVTLYQERYGLFERHQDIEMPGAALGKHLAMEGDKLVMVDGSLGRTFLSLLEAGGWGEPTELTGDDPVAPTSYGGPVAINAGHIYSSSDTYTNAAYVAVHAPGQTHTTSLAYLQGARVLDLEPREGGIVALTDSALVQVGPGGTAELLCHSPSWNLEYKPGQYLAIGATDIMVARPADDRVMVFKQDEGTWYQAHDVERPLAVQLDLAGHSFGSAIYMLGTELAVADGGSAVHVIDPSQGPPPEECNQQITMIGCTPCPNDFNAFMLCPHVDTCPVTLRFYCPGLGASVVDASKSILDFLWPFRPPPLLLQGFVLNGEHEPVDPVSATYPAPPSSLAWGRALDAHEGELLIAHGTTSSGAVTRTDPPGPVDIGHLTNVRLVPPHTGFQARATYAEPANHPIGSEWAGPRTSSAHNPAYSLSPGLYQIEHLATDASGATTATSLKVLACHGVASDQGYHGEDPILDQLVVAQTDNFAISYHGIATGSSVTLGAAACPLAAGFDNPGPLAFPTVRTVTIQEEDYTSVSMAYVRLEVYFSSAELSALGITEDTLTIHYWNGAAWIDTQLTPGTILGATPEKDLQIYAGGRAEGYLWLEMDHFSTYALAGALPPPPPTSSGGGSSSNNDPPPEPPAPEPEPAPAPSPPPSAPPAPQPSTPAPAPSTPSDDPVTLALFDSEGRPLTNLGRGMILAEIENAPDGSFLVVRGPDGEQRIPIEDGKATYQSQGNGPARFQVARDTSVYAATQIFIENPRVSAEAGVVSVGAAALALALGSIIAGPISGLWAAIIGTAAEETAIALSEEKLRKKRKKEFVKKSLIALFVAALLMTIFFTFEEVENLSWSSYLQAFPWVGGAALLMFLMAAFIEEMVLLSSRSKARFKFHLGGALVLALSAIFLRTAMGLPGFVDEVKAKGSPVIRSLASIAGYAGLVVPFAILVDIHYAFYEVGIMMCLAALATAALPFKPMPGNDIWHTHKGVSLATSALAFWFYGAFFVGLVGPAQVLIIGSIGLGLWAAMCTLMWAQTQVWYLDIAIAMTRWETRMIQTLPAWLVWIGTMPHRMLEWLGLGVDRVLESTEHGIEDGTEWVIHATHLDRIKRRDKGLAAMMVFKR